MPMDVARINKFETIHRATSSPATTSIHAFDPVHTYVERLALSLVPRDVCRDYGVFPLQVEDNILHTAMVNPFDADAIYEIQIFSGRAPRPHICTLAQWRDLWRRHIGPAPDDAPRLIDKNQPRIGSDAATPHRRILLAGDGRAAAREKVKELLCAQGHEVAEALDGVQALERVIQWEPDLLVVDMGTLRIPGTQVVSRVRQDLNQRTTPILMLTRANDDSRENAIRCGADDFVHTPADPALLVARVNALLRRRSRPTLAHAA
jgi:CheY-like chemotaxis protein